MLRVTGLVDGVVACNPVVGGVARGDLDPEPNAAVLVVFVVPEGGVRGGVVRVPVGVFWPPGRLCMSRIVVIVFGTLTPSIYL